MIRELPECERRGWVIHAYWRPSLEEVEDMEERLNEAGV